MNDSLYGLRLGLTLSGLIPRAKVYGPLGEEFDFTGVRLRNMATILKIRTATPLLSATLSGEAVTSPRRGDA